MSYKVAHQQLDGEQIISLVQPNEESKKNIQTSKNKSQQPNILAQNIQMDSRQEGVIQPPHFDGEQTIFMNKQEYISKGTPIYEEPLLLQDIGVEPGLVGDKIMAILRFQRPSVRFTQQTDLFGPFIIAFMFGLMLLLSGKMHFGDIYATFVIGNLLIFLLFNLMSTNETISLYNIMSTLGYCLLPMLIVSFLGIIVSLQNTLGIILSLGLSAWSAYAASNYIQIMMGLSTFDRRLLIAYPLYLYYVCFAMITIF